MIKITENRLQTAIEKIDGFDNAGYTEFIENFAKKQRNLLSYMLASADSLSDPGARDDLIYMLSVIWQAYSSLKKPIAKITDREIIKKEKDQIDAWEKLSNIDDDKQETTFIRKFITQPEIWDFMNEIVMPNKKGKTNFRTENDVTLCYALINMAVSLLNDKIKTTGGSK